MMLIIISMIPLMVIIIIITTSDTNDEVDLANNNMSTPSNKRLKTIDRYNKKVATRYI